MFPADLHVVDLVVVIVVAIATDKGIAQEKQRRGGVAGIAVGADPEAHYVVTRHQDGAPLPGEVPRLVMRLHGETTGSIARGRHHAATMTFEIIGGDLDPLSTETA
ncbi:hypothetical protein B0H67DRAFT_649555 [Lasiosphaeris hirsuta]|uniref:Uncharacterized protein n=1 Tax=Lasiosphaeris hirsuta TaxID=260670 RepID=A0AA40DIU2_9PEZI|nr:hypothetical protein B0H67DRAFT_649555 [Lasiosphaeris hirsuta]